MGTKLQIQTKTFIGGMPSLLVLTYAEPTNLDRFRKVTLIYKDLSGDHTWTAGLRFNSANATQATAQVFVTTHKSLLHVPGFFDRLLALFGLRWNRALAGTGRLTGNLQDPSKGETTDEIDRIEIEPADVTLIDVLGI